MTKVEAIECVLKQNGGSANLNTIYEKENHTNVTANSYGIIPNNAVCLFG